MHGSGQSLLEVEADWDVASAASLVLADLWLLGGSGGSSTVHGQSAGELTMLRVEISSGTITFSGAVTVTECALTSTQIIGSMAPSLLVLSDGTLTGSAISMTAGSVTLEGSTMVNSPVSITAATLSASQCELQSDGTSVPLTVESGGSATGVEFRSSADSR